MTKEKEKKQFEIRVGNKKKNGHNDKGNYQQHNAGREGNGRQENKGGVKCDRAGKKIYK